MCLHKHFQDYNYLYTERNGNRTSIANMYKYVQKFGCPNIQLELHCLLPKALSKLTDKIRNPAFFIFNSVALHIGWSECKFEN